MKDQVKSVRSSDYESPNPDWELIGARLANVRGRVPQKEMAKLLGVSPNTYSRLERGVRELGADKISLLVKAGWDANWLLTGEGSPRNGAGHGRDIDLDILALAIDGLETMLKTPGFPALSLRGKAELLMAIYQQKLTGEA